MAAWKYPIEGADTAHAQQQREAPTVGGGEWWKSNWHRANGQHLNYSGPDAAHVALVHRPISVIRSANVNRKAKTWEELLD